MRHYNQPAVGMTNTFKWQTESISKITHVPMIYTVCALAYEFRLVHIHLHACRYRTNAKFIAMSLSFSTTLPSRHTRSFPFIRSVFLHAHLFLFRSLSLVSPRSAYIFSLAIYRFNLMLLQCYIYAFGVEQRVRSWSANDD